jgi:hypothetical protein
LIKVIQACKCSIKLESNLLVSRKLVDELKVQRDDCLKGAISYLLANVETKNELDLNSKKYLIEQLNVLEEENNLVSSLTNNNGAGNTSTL